jgi:hypothetical protein
VENYIDEAETFPWLMHAAQSEKNRHFRVAALKELARRHRDSRETARILRNCVKDDEDRSVRNQALFLLASASAFDSGSLVFLKDIACSHASASTRKSAIIILGLICWGISVKWHCMGDITKGGQPVEVNIFRVNRESDCLDITSEAMMILKDKARSDPGQEVRLAATYALAGCGKVDADTFAILSATLGSDLSEHGLRSEATGYMQRLARDLAVETLPEAPNQTKSTLDE